jgi:hypothetical protein
MNFRQGATVAFAGLQDGFFKMGFAEGAKGPDHVTDATRIPTSAEGWANKTAWARGRTAGLRFWRYETAQTQIEALLMADAFDPENNAEHLALQQAAAI